MVGSSQWAVRRQEQARAVPPAGSRPSLTVLICARNERLVLPACLDALRAQTEPAEEILVLDDGSTDAMPGWLEQEFALRFESRPIRRSARRAAGPHCASCASRTPARPIRSTRVGNWPRAKSSSRSMRTPTWSRVRCAAIRDAFARDPQLGIAGGVLTPVCQRTPWAGFFQFFQTFEYARGFLWRLTWMQYDMLLLISGAFAAYRRTHARGRGRLRHLQLGGGLRADPPHLPRCLRPRRARAVQTLSGARATTDCPARAHFLNQRRRWFAGFIATHFQYHGMVGNGRYGPVGRYMMCVKTLDLLLPIYALASAVVLVCILAVRHGLAPIIWKLIVAKLVFDLVLHAYAIVLYQRWLGIPLARKLWVQSFGATLSEPFVFQILRQLGAVFGWLAFLRRRIDWEAQRPSA